VLCFKVAKSDLKFIVCNLFHIYLRFVDKYWCLCIRIVDCYLNILWYYLIIIVDFNVNVGEKLVIIS
jgi:hypothetical protein